MDKSSYTKNILVIKPHKGWIDLNLKEFWRYRELLYFLIWRDIKIRYKQTLIGIAWAVLQPFLTMVIFSIFFGKIVKILSEGIPYPIFSYSGLLLWTYFSFAVSNASNCLIASPNLVTKVYFPRLVMPLSSAITGIIDYLIAMFILILMMFFYGFFPKSSIVFLPLIIIFTFFSASGLGLWLSALNVKYRDVCYVIPFLIQSLLFATPVIYPMTIIPERYKWILYLHPISGMIDAHRACILGHKPIGWVLLGASTLVALVIFVSGLIYFRRTERFFADII